MYEEIQPKPTQYKGIHYRSRLEARWALFFDYLKIPVEYEPKQFYLENFRYTPDFGIGNTTFIEIKPSTVPLGTLKKAQNLATQFRLNVFIFGGDFYEYRDMQIIKFNALGILSFDYDFRYCPACDALKLDNVGKCRVCQSELIEQTHTKEKVKYYTF